MFKSYLRHAALYFFIHKPGERIVLGLLGRRGRVPELSQDLGSHVVDLLRRFDLKHLPKASDLDKEASARVSPVLPLPLSATLLSSVWLR